MGQGLEWGILNERTREGLMIGRYPGKYQTVPGRENSKCKGPKVGVLLRNPKSQ